MPSKPTQPTAATFEDLDRTTDRVGSSGLLPERYVDLGVLGSGGMGQVRRVRDTHLDRTVALKLLRPDIAQVTHLRRRFLNEVRLTAGLQHPGIVPVHDWGELSDGQLWFTMKEIAGQTLAAVINDAHASPEALPLRRLVGMLQACCQAVAYAHTRGVLHRDLKPANVMIGAFGEVLVVDWGVAGIRDAALAADEAGWEDGGQTRVGAVVGTPAWMSPEQARGEVDAHSPRSDVYGLGAMLYTILTGQPPYPGDGQRAWRAVLAGPPDAPDARTTRPLPAALVAICTHAMARDPADRLVDAAAVSAALQAWLDGAQRAAEAEALLAEADALADRPRSLREEAARLRREALHALAPTRPHDPAEAKAAGWALQEQAAQCLRDADAAALEHELRLRAALLRSPDLPAIHRRLAEHYRDRLLEAERSRSAQDIARFERLLRDHARGPQRAWLASAGAATLLTDPPGATVTLHRYVPRLRQLVAEPVRELGVTPLVAVSLPPGSYLLTLRAPGHAEVRYPIHLRRGEHWDGVPPEGGGPVPVVLPRVGELSADEVYVPAGWFRCGGDPEALDSFPERWVWVDAFVTTRFPVTHRQYLGFLNALVAAGRGAEAERWAPRNYATDEQPYILGPEGYRFQPQEDGLIGSNLDAPVSLISWDAAAAWAAHHGRRLLHDLEWEKAARGTDGRYYPWGDDFDPSFCAMQSSYPGEPVLPSVEDFPVDVSPYGLRCAAGHVREWCASTYLRAAPESHRPTPAPEEAEFRMIRGGGFGASAAYCRIAGRFAGQSHRNSPIIGFRTARLLRG